MHTPNDPDLKNGELPHFTYRWHRNIFPGIAAWANKRVETNKAVDMDVHNISGTEWSMFSAVFYLWGTEALQAHKRGIAAPAIYAKPAIEAAASAFSIGAARVNSSFNQAYPLAAEALVAA